MYEVLVFLANLTKKHKLPMNLMEVVGNEECLNGHDGKFIQFQKLPPSLVCEGVQQGFQLVMTF